MFGRKIDTQVKQWIVGGRVEPENVRPFLVDGEKLLEGGDVVDTRSVGTMIEGESVLGRYDGGVARESEPAALARSMNWKPWWAAAGSAESRMHFPVVLCMPVSSQRRESMAVLVAAASKHGATTEIAERVAAGLADRGIAVEVRELHEVERVEDYEAVVLGSAIYFGKWMKPALQFVDDHAGDLAERPTWLFASGTVTGNPPVAEDPNAIGVSLVEKLIASTQAREHKLFAGRLDSRKLSLVERLPTRMAGGREGDWRDWDAVDAWAAQIADDLDRFGIEHSGEARSKRLGGVG